MPDEETKDSTPDQPETPEPEVAPEPDQSPAPETPEPETPASPTDEEKRFTQAAFTKLTQEYAGRFRSLEDKLDQVLATRPGAPAQAEPEPVENPQVDRVIRGSKVVRDLEERNKKLEKTVAALAQAAVSQQFPDLKDEMPQFQAWMNQNPGVQNLSDKAIMGAYRAEFPAKTVRARQASPAPAKPAPPKVEGSSRPGGVPRDVRDILREKGHTGVIPLGPAFDEAYKLAKQSG